MFRNLKNILITEEAPFNFKCIAESSKLKYSLVS